MKRINFNIKDRNFLYGLLSIVFVCVFTLSIAYAALNAVLTISGNAEVAASNWYIHLDNAKVKNGSATSDVPIISGNSLTFSTTFNMPGDYYEFTVDVVNEGTIDAMIESVTTTPELDASQKKYLKYEVSYANGESIDVKQTLTKKTSMPIKVRLEYRNDLVGSDLPSSSITLSFNVTFVYSQSDGTGSSVTNNGVSDTMTIVSGNINTQGSEVCFGDQCFYVLSNDGSTVSLLSKYNLLVGNKYISDAEGQVPLENPTGIQDSKALAGVYDAASGMAIFPWYGIIAFSSSAYWSSSNYPAYVYDSNSNLFNHVENYKSYLQQRGLGIKVARLITYEELVDLGCYITSDNGWGLDDTNSCFEAPSWVYSTSYWSGSAEDSEGIYSVNSDYFFSGISYDHSFINGIRPVIEVPISEF